MKDFYVVGTQIKCYRLYSARQLEQVTMTSMSVQWRPYSRSVTQLVEPKRWFFALFTFHI